MLRSRDFGLIAGAVCVSALGDWLALAALALHLEESTESGIAVAALFIALWSPLIFLAGVAGLIVDRFDARRVLVLASIAQAAVAAGLAFADSLAPVLVLALLLGIGNAVSQPAEFALIPAVVDEARMNEANAHVETARYLGFMAGPLLGGLLAAGGGTRLAMIVNATSFLAIAGAAALVRQAHAPAHASAEPADLGRARDGIVFLLRDDVLRVVLAVAFASLLFMTASVTAEVFFAKDVLDAGDVGFGALYTAWAVGMAAGALALSRRVPVSAMATVALVAIVVQSLGLALPTLWLLLAFALVSYVIGGAAHGLKNVLLRTLIHQRVPGRLHGRAFAAYNGLRNAAELFALAAGGLLVVAIGARWTLLVAGAVPAAAGVVGLVVFRRLRERPRAGAEQPIPDGTGA